MAMVYTIGEELREYLEQNNRPGVDNSMHAKMMRREQDKEQAEAVVVQEEADEAAEEGAPARTSCPASRGPGPSP